MPAEEHLRREVVLFVSQTIPEINWEEVKQESYQNKPQFSWAVPGGNKNRIEVNPEGLHFYR